MTRIYDAPINYKGSDGAWHAIDSTLVVGLGGYENAADGFSLRIPEALSAGVSLTEEGQTLSFALEGASTAPPAVAGSTASYGEVLPSTDLEYVSESTGLEELATLTGSDAPTALDYRLSLSSGLAPRAEPDGSIAAIGASGAQVFTILAPVAYSETAGPASGRRLPMTLASSGSGWLVSVDTGEAWVREALARGPVVVDPSVSLEPWGSCTLSKEAPETAKCGLTMQEGYDSTHEENRDLLLFKVEKIPVGAEVLHATLGIDLESHSTSSAKPVGVYRLTRSWTANKATWDTYDGTHEWKTPGGDYAEGSDANINTSVGTATGWNYWYPTQMVQEWVNGTNAPAGVGAEDDGFLVKDETGSKTANLLTFYSSGVERAKKPYLEVAYAPRGTGEQPEYTVLSKPLTNDLSLGVNVASGDLIVQNTDLSMSGVAGLNFESTRTWNGFSNVGNQYAGWLDSNYALNHLTVYPDRTVATETPSGAWITFIRQPTGVYTTPPGFAGHLCEVEHDEQCYKETFPEGAKYELEFATGQHIFYDGEGLGSGIRDRFGNVIKYERAPKEKVVLTDTHGHKVEELENKNAEITEVKDVSGSRSTRYHYEKREGNEFLTSFVDADGNTTKYHPVDTDQIETIELPSKDVTTIEYENPVNEVRRVAGIKQTGSSGVMTTKFVYYEGTKVPTACKGTFKATIVEDPDWPGLKEGKAPKLHETLYCANVLDEIEHIVDASGNVTTQAYDPHGNTTSVTLPLIEGAKSPGVTSYVYKTPEEVDLECEVTDLTEAVTKCPEPSKEGYAENARYQDSVFGFAATESISARGNLGYECYWSGGAKCKGEEATKGTGAPGALRQEVIDAAKPTETPKLYTTAYSYEEDGEPKAITDFRGNVTDYEYNAAKYRTAIIPPSGGTVQKTIIEPDADGRPHTVTQCLNETCTEHDVATYTYNDVSETTEAVYTGPVATTTYKYEYGPDGNLVTSEGPAGTTEYTWDEAGRVTEEVLPGGHNSDYTYDDANNLTGFTDAGGTTTYLYNGLNELEAMAEPGGKCTGAHEKCTEFTYNNDEWRTQVKYPSGVVAKYALANSTGRVQAIEATGDGQTISNEYSYYENGKLDTPEIYKDTFDILGTKGETDYSYTPLEELEDAATSSATKARQSCYIYDYDEDGNVIVQEWGLETESCPNNRHLTYNADDELMCRTQPPETACSGKTVVTTYDYDGAGDETKIAGVKEGPEPETTELKYNNAKQLVGLTPLGEAEQSLSYLTGDQTTLTGIGSTTLEQTALGITAQTNAGGTSYYARTPEGTLVDERLPGGTTYNPVYDAQGDVIALTNTAAEFAQTIEYGPYGENAKASGSVKYSATTDPFLFKGGYHFLTGGDSGHGNIPNDVYHFGQRYYDPTTSRWTQPDPAGSGDEYQAEDDDPENLSDPSGERIPGRAVVPYLCQALYEGRWRHLSGREYRELAGLCVREEKQLEVEEEAHEGATFEVEPRAV